MNNFFNSNFLVNKYQKFKPMDYGVNLVYWGLNSFFFIIIPMLIRNKIEGTLILKLASVKRLNVCQKILMKVRQNSYKSSVLRSSAPPASGQQA